MLCVHRLREGFKADRVACINRVRGLLAEFGLVFPQGPKQLLSILEDVIEDASNELGYLARLVLQRALSQWRELDTHLAWCDERIGAHIKSSDDAQRALALQGVGPITASAAVATVGDFKQFKNGSQFAAWLGLTPSQHSSGGKARLGAMTKRGDIYLRTMLIQAAKSAVFVAHRRKDPISAWITRLRDRAGWQRAAVALANKNARILWVIMTKGEAFDPKHISVTPGAAPTAPA